MCNGFERARYTAHLRVPWTTFLRGLRIAKGGVGENRTSLRLVSAKGTPYVLGECLAAGGFGFIHIAFTNVAVGAKEPKRFVVKIFDTWEEARRDFRGIRVVDVKRQGFVPITEGHVIWPPHALFMAVTVDQRTEEYEVSTYHCLFVLRTSIARWRTLELSSAQTRSWRTASSGFAELRYAL